MAKDKYTAVWVSHSSMGDFLKCPRAYYLHYVYKDPKTGRKQNIVNPFLSLGQVVHETLESLKTIPSEERMNRDLLSDFERIWGKVTGKKGGFTSQPEESELKARGKQMIERVINKPGPLNNKTVQIKQGHNNMPSNFYLSDDENIILCGLIDWVEYVDIDDSVRILDFKTGKQDENDGSLQLPIYLLLLNALQGRKVSGASYWYLDRDNSPTPMELPDIDEARRKVLSVALNVKKARDNMEFGCPQGDKGCFACRPYEAILSGEAEYLGIAGFGQDTYFLPK